MTGSRIYMSGQRKGIGQLPTNVQLFHEKSKIGSPKFISWSIFDSQKKRKRHLLLVCWFSVYSKKNTKD